MKKCCRCGEEKSRASFCVRAASPDGLQYTCRDCQRVWRAENRERVAALGRSWYLANRERRAAMSRNWDKTNPDGRRIIKARRRAREAGARFVPMTRRELRRLYSQDCAHCGASENLHRDHITPLSRGGDDTFANSQMLCQSCNCSKGAKLEIEARAYRRMITREVA